MSAKLPPLVAGLLDRGDAESTPALVAALEQVRGRDAADVHRAHSPRPRRRQAFAHGLLTPSCIRPEHDVALAKVPPRSLGRPAALTVDRQSRAQVGEARRRLLAAQLLAGETLALLHTSPDIECVGGAASVRARR